MVQIICSCLIVDEVAVVLFCEMFVIVIVMCVVYMMDVLHYIIYIVLCIVEKSVLCLCVRFVIDFVFMVVGVCVYSI